MRGACAYCPDATLAEAPQLDLLHVPGGFGQEALMEDTELLDWVRRQAAGPRHVFCMHGCSHLRRAGLLKGRRATTHWSAFHLLPYFGAIPADERVVVDGNLICTAGVTAGIDGALRMAAELRGEEATQLVQLQMQYAPEPPFNSGTPTTAPAAILERARQGVRVISEQRQRTAQQAARRLGITLASAEMP
jgi:cyclohexyl-isocyanide hydratase